MTGKHVFFYLGAFFLFIAAADAWMIILAIRTHSGVITDHAYEKGLAYNQVVAAHQKQEEFGWKGVIDYRNGLVHFALRDKNGVALSPRKTMATFTRPTHAGMDFSVELSHADTAVDFPAKGLWEIRVDAVVGDRLFQQSRRIMVK